MSKVTAASLAITALACFARWRGLIGSGAVRRAVRVGDAVARRTMLVAILLGLAVLLVRAALLPVWPIPKPVIYDEFSYLLQADTFARGRLTNPPHPLWQFFESIYIIQQPTYASKYPPGQALAMAVGQVVFGHPWFGVWLSCGALATALCWALQGWFRPGWALLGALIMFELCVFSYWMNSYWGGAVAGIGGALVMGAWIRIARNREAPYAWLLGVGAVVLMFTRPYEGLLLVATAAIALFLRDRRARVWLPIVGLIAAGVAWQGFYDYRVTGNPLRMPYQEYFEQYESVPPLTILPVQPTRAFRHFDLEFMDSGWTRDTNAKARSLQLPVIRGGDLAESANSFFDSPIWVGILLGMAPAWLVSRRLRLPVVLVGVLIAGAMIELIFYAHYAAPFTAALLILLIESLRQLRLWLARSSLARKPGRLVAGQFVILVLAGTLLAGELASSAWHVYNHTTADQVQPANSRRGFIEKDLLERGAEEHVIFVRYTGRDSPHAEWIYNPADIDKSPVIWAQDMGAENNKKLMEYYRGRSFWLFEPDKDWQNVRPYSEQ